MLVHTGTVSCCSPAPTTHLSSTVTGKALTAGLEKSILMRREPWGLSEGQANR